MERFVLPPHRFYPVRVKHEVTAEERNYFIFHLLGDFTTEMYAAYWPSMKFYVKKEKTKEIVQAFPQESAIDYDNYLRIYRGFSSEYDLDDIFPYFPYYVYREPYDLVWGENGRMAMSLEMGQVLLDEFGWEVVGDYSRKPIITGFNPETDQLPEEFLAL